MAATTTSSRTADFIERIAKDYPQFSFKPGSQEHWSPRTKTITYDKAASADDLRYGLLHELAHALLNHNNYRSDFELLKLESHREGHTVFVRPELVLEIAFSDIQDSPRYPAGLALRFARVKRYRPDKSAQEADTIQTVTELFQAQRA